MARALRVLIIAIAVPACHDLFDGVLPYVCPAAPDDELARLPARISETGLFDDVAAERLAPGVMAYRPEFELWSDGAAKRRWLWLPPGAQIDTADADDWIFPDGTRAWKEFSRDGARIETRLLAKEDGAWLAQSYLWFGDDAVAAPAGYVDANGTAHDVPAAGECVACHGGRRSFVLGVSAVQLARDAPPGEIDLADLASGGRLTAEIAPPVVPGDPVARAALGYLHANCGHCHNATKSLDKPCFAPTNDYEFWLALDQLSSVDATPAYATAIDAAIIPGDPDGSLIAQRLATKDLFTRMPPLASREVDSEGIALLRRWIEELE